MGHHLTVVRNGGDIVNDDSDVPMCISQQFSTKSQTFQETLHGHVVKTKLKKHQSQAVEA